MIDTNALRKKILELAIRGKLTQGYRKDPFNRAIAQKNFPHEGGGSGFGEAKDERGLIYLTAEELYNQIQAEKQRLIAVGKIKKEKPLPPIKEEEIPFEIPKTWKWSRWGNISLFIQYGYNAPAKNTGAVKMVRITDIQNDKIDWATVPFCSIPDSDIDKYILKKNDILFARTGATVGKSYLVKDIPEKSIFSGYLIRTQYSNLLCSDYIKYFMGSDLYWQQLKNGTTITTQPNCNGQTLSKMIIPLPPLAEQYHIVEAIKKSLEELSIIDEMQKSLSSDAVSFKKKILELAIQGKLVEQRPEDGNAEELYNQIQTEKQRLIAEGKIKKEKPLPPIKEEEIPFEIPRTWKWVRIIDILNILNGDRGKNYPAKSTLSNKGIPFISAINLDGKTVVDDEKLMCLTDEQYEKLSNGKLRQGDIVVCIRGSLGKHGRYPFEKGAIASSLIILREYLPSDITADYIMHYLDTNLFFDEIDSFDNGTAQPNLSACNFKNFLLPLPPLAEQHRIVVKIEQLFAIADKLINN